MCQKFGFDAYGMSQDMPDPVAKSMQAMLDHMHAVDERIGNMCQTLRRLDHSYRAGQMPGIKDEDFAGILEDVDKACEPVVGSRHNATPPRDTAADDSGSPDSDEHSADPQLSTTAPDDASAHRESSRHRQEG